MNMPSHSLPSAIASSLNHFNIRTFTLVSSSGCWIPMILPVNHQPRRPVMNMYIYLSLGPVGLSVSHLGNSSIRYRLGLFRFLHRESPHSLDLIHGHFSGDKHDLAPQLNVKALACGTFVHVVVNPTTQVPTNIPSRWRENLQTLVISVWSCGIFMTSCSDVFFFTFLQTLQC